VAFVEGGFWGLWAAKKTAGKLPLPQIHPVVRLRISERGRKQSKQSDYWVRSGAGRQTARQKIPMRTILRTIQFLPVVWKRDSGGENIDPVSGMLWDTRAVSLVLFLGPLA